MTRVLTILALAALPWLASAADPGTGDTTAALLAAVAKSPPTQTRFAEAHFSPMLDRALVTYGTLRWKGGHHLQREVTQPYTESTDITDGEVRVTRPGHGTRRFSLDRAPALKALLHGLVAVLSGDVADLRQTFRVRLDGGGGDGWTLTLWPTSADMARRLAVIRLDGNRHRLRCIEISDSRGGATLDLLGELAAKMPARPTRAALTALCRAP